MGQRYPYRCLNSNRVYPLLCVRSFLFYFEGSIHLSFVCVFTHPAPSLFNYPDVLHLPLLYLPSLVHLSISVSWFLCHFVVLLCSNPLWSPLWTDIFHLMCLSVIFSCLLEFLDWFFVDFLDFTVPILDSRLRYARFVSLLLTFLLHFSLLSACPFFHSALNEQVWLKHVWHASAATLRCWKRLILYPPIFPDMMQIAPLVFYLANQKICVSVLLILVFQRLRVPEIKLCLKQWIVKVQLDSCAWVCRCEQ